MKTFKELTEDVLAEKNLVIGGQKIVITKVGKDFKATIDGEHLDNYGSEKEAISMAKEFITQFKKG